VKRSKELIIGKRDGSTEAFSHVKLRRCLVATMRVCGYDVRLAEPLTQAVAMHLEQWVDPRPPTSDYIYRCLRAALTQTGMTNAAEQLAAHRRQRRLSRRGLRVHDSQRSAADAVPWQKAAIVRTLEGRYGLGRSPARILAAEVETRALALDYHVISTALVAELVRNELMAWGLSGETFEPAQRARRADAVTGSRPTQED
jgi:hypothetical protein